jgi:hypothetical protein
MSERELLHENDLVRVYGVQDLNPGDPREFDAYLGTMVCWHSRYALGDEQPREDWTEYFAGVLGMDMDDRDLNRDQVVHAMDRELIVLPLYVYEHGNITIQTAPFSCYWDSGQVGFVYVERRVAKEQMGWTRMTQGRIEQIETWLQAEVAEYDAYISGETYGMVVVDSRDDLLDSCYGFYGADALAAGARDAFEFWTTELRIKDPNGQYVFDFDEPKTNTHATR